MARKKGIGFITRIPIEEVGLPDYLTPEEMDFYIYNGQVPAIEEFLYLSASETVQIKVIKLHGIHLPLIAFLKPKRKYLVIFDERIFTEKLLGKPSPGLPPPSMLAA